VNRVFSSSPATMEKAATVALRRPLRLQRDSQPGLSAGAGLVPDCVPRGLDRASRGPENMDDYSTFYPTNQRRVVMAQILLVDDEPNLIAEQVRHAVPAPAHRIGVA